jgi:MFS family permease
VSDHRAESLTVNAAGLVQGIALVTFPAASGIFTSRTGYDLTSSQYGLMFAPQVVTAIVAALLGAGLLWPRFTARVSEKGTYLAGLAADLAAMVLLVASWGVAHQHAAAYGLLLAATACLGAGFGFTVPSLNTLTAALHPGAEDRSVLVLNALLGLGTALAPAFVAVFNGIGFWIGLPILSRRAAGRPDRGQPAAAAQASRGARADAAARAGAYGAAGPVLGVRPVRLLVRDMRDDERQLVPARPRVARRQVSDRVARADRLLGHGDRRPGADRRAPALAAQPGRLPWPAVPARRRLRAHRGAAA